MDITWFGGIELNLLVKNNEGEKVPVYFFTDKNKNKEGITLLENKAAETGRNNDNFIVSSPGEYDVRGIFIEAIPSLSSNDYKIIYKIRAEGMKICHLGSFSKKEIGSKELEAIGETDILFLPIGDGFANAEEAGKIISQIEPKAVIPTAYENQSQLEKFLKIMGIKDAEAQKKLKIDIKSLPKEEMKVFVIEK